MDHSTFSRPVQCAQEWVAKIVCPGDVVVDATAGNGHDCLFLARLVGETGCVHAFDIQPRALESTRSLLMENGFSCENIMLHCASHALMERVVAPGVKAVMFNLGYLPGGDKLLISTTDETIRALRSALKLIEAGGVLSVVCYPGHEGGDTEAAAVADLLCSLDAGKWRVAELTHANAPSPAPFLLAAFRLK